MNDTIAYIVTPNTSQILTDTGFIDEYELLKPFFKRFGKTLVSVDWQDPDVDWGGFDFVVPKNMWNYFDHYEKFLKWIERLSGQKVCFKNSLEIVLWNSDKSYLAELASKGAYVAPLRYIESPDDLRLIEELLVSCEKIILKPAVSGGGKQTQVYDFRSGGECLANAKKILRECALVVQPFLPEIAQGEWSFFFFGDSFSHAIVKIPKPGDFRAHSLFGAVNRPVDPGVGQIEEARSFLQYAPTRPHYARVDGIYVQNRLQLIELEAIEPYLYFEHAPREAPLRFVRALLAGD